MQKQAKMKKTNTRRYRNYENSKMKAFEDLLNQPALDYKAPKYQVLLSDLQAGILKHHKKKYAQYLFVQFNEGKQNTVKKWISSFAGKITSALTQLDEHNNRKKTIITFSLTNKGYDYLEIPNSVRPDDPAFHGNMNERVKFEKDRISKNFLKSNTIHAIILIASHEEKDAKQIENILDCKTDLLKILFQQTGNSGAIPFGSSKYKDGMSNPEYFPGASGSNRKKIINRDQLPNLDAALLLDKGGNTDAPSGSLGVFARFEFQQMAIQELVKQIKEQANIQNKDLAEAYIIGRFKDGSPLTLTDRCIDDPSDHFDYKELMKTKDGLRMQTDEEGSRCPFFAHARKANPRYKESAALRITRRGVYYEKNSKTQGLLFVSYQNSIENQFEYITNHWMMNELIETDTSYSSSDFKTYDSFEKDQLRVYKPSGVDMLFANPGMRYQVPLNWNHSDSPTATIEIKKRLIDYEGGVYFFTPSISFLKKIKFFPSSKERKTEITRVAFDLLKEENGRHSIPFNPGSTMKLATMEELPEKQKRDLDKLYIKHGSQVFGYHIKQTQLVTIENHFK